MIVVISKVVYLAIQGVKPDLTRLVLSYMMVLDGDDGKGEGDLGFVYFAKCQAKGSTT